MPITGCPENQLVESSNLRARLFKPRKVRQERRLSTVGYI